MTFNNRLIVAEEQRLYNHVLEFAQVEMPDQLLERLRQLFVEGVSYRDASVLADLDAIVLSDYAAAEFRFILNRCIHILTNRWQGRPQMHYAVPRLLDVLDASPQQPISKHPRQRSLKRLRELMSQFRQTEQYLAIKRLATLISQEGEAIQTQPLGYLIRRYPYLYPHCLISEGCSNEDQQSVRQLQEKAQYKFEVDLSRYVTYQVRRLDLLQTSSEDSVGRILTPVKNPTLLTDLEACESLRHFVGKIDGESTHRDLAYRFLNYTQDTQSFGRFKGDLYEYLETAIDPEYGHRQFNKLLYRQLRMILPDQDDQPVNEFLVTRLCSQLMNFLIVQSPQQPRHFVFVDLISNIGPMWTTSLLLRILLICSKVKPYLEKRLSILFNHYESCAQGSVEWLVMVMEHLNLALSTNFGQMSLPFVSRI
ncbi:hypothetical protein IQ266_01305 [filamentous cyanobacterium LEGE 11480]|uniref:Uncharacterized protein n=1 Tax=Romeriopsis navalis LEGE 11480 TaxID=2777977 RepID=A0A928VKU8_9CYAN|nr:hypothetical protein [Romeriopsis navalis]MBE9028390.1 hypothetical protein [Romeriopsis navalis LEGE 11480]